MPTATAEESTGEESGGEATGCRLTRRDGIEREKEISFFWVFFFTPYFFPFFAFSYGPSRERDGGAKAARCDLGHETMNESGSKLPSRSAAHHARAHYTRAITGNKFSFGPSNLSLNVKPDVRITFPNFRKKCKRSS